jgi:hypothetical protein
VKNRPKCCPLYTFIKFNTFKKPSKDASVESEWPKEFLKTTVTVSGTRLGVFSPNGRLFKLGTLKKHIEKAHNFGLILTKV